MRNLDDYSHSLLVRKSHSQQKEEKFRLYKKNP